MTSIMAVIGAKGTKRPHSGKEGYYQKKKKRMAAPLISSGCTAKRSSTSNWDDEEPPRKRAAYSDRGDISVPLAKSQLNIGTSLSLNDFVFYRELGEGTYGKVMLARWSINSKWVAVKAIKKQVLLEGDKESTLVERRVMETAAGCPFLTQMYAAFQTQDNIFFVMEYLSEGDLFQLLQENGPLDPDTTKFYAAEIVCGIKYLHNRGIIHRDLKPENILIDSNGHAKIGDFGLAVETMTCGQKATGYAGTEGYIAPEIQNGKRYNTAVDWYSFGAILYNMVTGEFPEESPSSQKLTFPSSVSSHTKDLIRKLLVKDPVRRQQVADTICSHPFFRSINWEDLQKGRIQPPFPKLMEKNKFYVAEESPFSSTDALEPPIASEDQQLFRGFSFMGSDL